MPARRRTSILVGGRPENLAVAALPTSNWPMADGNSLLIFATPAPARRPREVRLSADGAAPPLPDRAEPGVNGPGTVTIAPGETARVYWTGTLPAGAKAVEARLSIADARADDNALRPRPRRAGPAAAVRRRVRRGCRVLRQAAGRPSACHAGGLAGRGRFWSSPPVQRGGLGRPADLGRRAAADGLPTRPPSPSEFCLASRPTPTPSSAMRISPNCRWLRSLRCGRPARPANRRPLGPIREKSPRPNGTGRPHRAAHRVGAWPSHFPVPPATWLGPGRLGGVGGGLLDSFLPLAHRTPPLPPGRPLADDDRPLPPDVLANLPVEGAAPPFRLSRCFWLWRKPVDARLVAGRQAGIRRFLNLAKLSVASRNRRRPSRLKRHA